MADLLFMVITIAFFAVCVGVRARCVTASSGPTRAPETRHRVGRVSRAELEEVGA